jgi:homoserine dehydrogenase
MKQINIGLLGLGVVGSGTFENLAKNADLIAERLGVRLAITRVAEKDAKRRATVAGRAAVTAEAAEILADPSIDIVIELIGGCDAARKLILDALRHGKTVVTANKALLALHGAEIFHAAEKHNASIYFEASVCGGIPIIKVIREGLVANRFQLIYGIVNGTCNYILTQMTESPTDFDTVLKDAQAKGYAEANPALDIDGIDAAHKTTILASLAAGRWFEFSDVHVEGIRAIEPLDIERAGELGYRIKLLAVVKADGDEGSVFEAHVHPTLIPKNHVLASVGGAFNAVCVRGDVVGDTMFYGRGAGAMATSSAIIADLADAARDLIIKANAPNSARWLTGFRAHAKSAKIKSVDDVSSRYYLRATVEDRPGVLAQLATILGSANVSIASVLQHETTEGKPQGHVPLIFMTHTALHRAIRKAVDEIDRLPMVKAKTMVLRVENFE